MKQLFRKSNILHIRTNKGEFEVSNPEAANQFTIDDGNGFIFGLKSVEWPYGVELNWRIAISTARDVLVDTYKDKRWGIGVAAGYGAFVHEGEVKVGPGSHETETTPQGKEESQQEIEISYRTKDGSNGSSSIKCAISSYEYNIHAVS